MHPARELLRERSIDRPMPPHEVLPAERLAHDHDLEVRLRSGRHAVVARLVDHLEHARRKRLHEPIVNRILHRSRVHGQFFASIVMALATPCAMSRTAMSSSLLKCFMPSETIVLQNGQPTATVSTPASMISLLRLTLTRFSLSSSTHMRPPPAP